MMTQAQPTHDYWRYGLAQRARWLVVASSAGLLSPLLSHALASIDGRLPWLVDLAAHWQWLWLLLLLLAAPIAGLTDRRWWLALVMAPLPLLTAAPIAPRAIVAGEDVVIASVNVHLDSVDVHPLAQWLATQQADVVVVLEVSPRYAEGLRTLVDYPYQHIAAAYDPFGIALLSRHPIAEVAVVRDAEEPARIDAEIQLPGSCVALTALHPMPPISHEFHHQRNVRMQALAQAAGERSMPTLLIGDLNATPWSSAFSGLADLGLRRASGLQPSWPTAGLGVLGIPIDHVLVSPHWRLVDSRRGGMSGSDHFPLVVRLRLAEPAESSAVHCPAR